MKLGFGNLSISLNTTFGGAMDSPAVRPGFRWVVEKANLFASVTAVDLVSGIYISNFSIPSPLPPLGAPTTALTQSQTLFLRVDSPSDHIVGGNNLPTNVIQFVALKRFVVPPNCFIRGYVEGNAAVAFGPLAFANLIWQYYEEPDD